MPAEQVRVLIVDDQQIFVDALRLFLERDGRIDVVGVATDAETAIDLAVEHEADVVLMDITMPRMNGVDATRELLARRPSARVVVLSGDSHGRAEADALGAGAAGFLLKGSLSDEIVAKILEVAPRTLPRSS
jgi:DNA-binding NarL/FixJ family response regulator